MKPNMQLIQLAHFFAAVLAVWRIVGLFTVDRITLKLRQRFPWYIFCCQRCFSVWAGIFATALFFLWPWANWPFALSWLYLWHAESIVTRNAARELRNLSEYRDLHIRVARDNKADILKNQLFPNEVASLLGQMTQPKQPGQS